MDIMEVVNVQRRLTTHACRFPGARTCTFLSAVNPVHMTHKHLKATSWSVFTPGTRRENEPSCPDELYFAGGCSLERFRLESSLPCLAPISNEWYQCASSIQMLQTHSRPFCRAILELRHREAAIDWISMNPSNKSEVRSNSDGCATASSNNSARWRSL